LQKQTDRCPVPQGGTGSDTSKDNNKSGRKNNVKSNSNFKDARLKSKAVGRDKFKSDVQC
jgi:hypothetical protein